MTELDDVLKKENLIIGTKRSLKLLKNEKLKKIFIASIQKQYSKILRYLIL